MTSDIGTGKNWQWVRYNLRDHMRPLTRRDCRDLWYNLARIRERNGDKEGAKRARFAAQCTSGDNRVRHDI